MKEVLISDVMSFFKDSCGLGSSKVSAMISVNRTSIHKIMGKPLVSEKDKAVGRKLYLLLIALNKMIKARVTKKNMTYVLSVPSCEDDTGFLVSILNYIASNKSDLIALNTIIDKSISKYFEEGKKIKTLLDEFNSETCLTDNLH